MSQTIALCVICRDEEDVLERCLASAQPYVDEIVVVDTGSTDNTREIAVKYATVVRSFAWCDDFAAARNVTLDVATADWILSLDADEILDGETAPALRRLVAQSAGFRSYGLLIKTVQERNGRNEWTELHGNRLFPRDKDVRWIRPVHEQVTYLPDPGAMEYHVTRDVVIYHDGYLKAQWVKKRKSERNLRILEKEVADKPTEPYAWHNLGRHWMNEQDYLKAIPPMVKAWSLLTPEVKRDAWVAEVYVLLTSAYLNTGRFVEGVNVGAEGAQHHPLSAGIWNNLGICYTNSQQPRHGILCFERALALRGVHTPYAVDPTTTGWKPLRNMALAYQALGEFVLAVESYWRAMQEAPDHSGLVIECATILAAIGEYRTAEKYCAAVLDREPENPMAKAVLAQIPHVRSLQVVTRSGTRRIGVTGVTVPDTTGGDLAGTVDDD